MGTFPEYFDKRASAIDKIPTIPSKSSTTSTSSSTTSGGKDGDEKKESSSTSTESKASLKQDADRANHVVAVDVSYYFQLKAALSGLMDSYAIAVDNLTKNYDKLRAPKGAGGGNSLSMCGGGGETRRGEGPGGAGRGGRALWETGRERGAGRKTLRLLVWFGNRAGAVVGSVVFCWAA
jgi:hypothetical protein